MHSMVLEQLPYFSVLRNLPQFLWNCYLGLGLVLAAINREALLKHGCQKDSPLFLMASTCRGRLCGRAWEADLQGPEPRTLPIGFSVLCDFLLRVTSWTKVTAGF